MLSEMPEHNTLCCVMPVFCMYLPACRFHEVSASTGQEVAPMFDSLFARAAEHVVAAGGVAAK